MTINDTAKLPHSGRLLRSFDGGEHRRRTPDAPLLAIAERLARHHEAQWDAEDLCRSPAVNDEELGRVKRRIDRFNGQRVDMVDELDRWVAAHLSQNHDSVCHTETYGMIVDRLAIGWVRVRKMSTSSDPRGLLAVAARQLAELASAYDTLVREVESRRRALPQWRSLKFYRTADIVSAVSTDSHQ